MKTICIVVSIALFSAGCASRQPINPDAVQESGILVDGKGKDRQLIVADAKECTAIARAGAPGPWSMAALARGDEGLSQDFKAAKRACMLGRGHSVLN